MQKPKPITNINLAVDAVAAALKAAQNARDAFDAAFTADEGDSQTRAENTLISSFFPPSIKLSNAERKRAQRARGGPTAESIRNRLCEEFIKVVRNSQGGPEPYVADVTCALLDTYPLSEHRKVYSYLGYTFPTE